MSLNFQALLLNKHSNNKHNSTSKPIVIMTEDATAGSDDFSGLGGFFFYVFLVHPITAWILRPGRFDRKKSIMYAITFLAALAAVKTGECCRKNHTQQAH